jgi:hypothetical protein
VKKELRIIEEIKIKTTIYFLLFLSVEKRLSFMKETIY